MSITRRQALKSASAAVLASSIAKPAIAQKSPIQIGYLPALTGGDVPDVDLPDAGSVRLVDAPVRPIARPPRE